MYALAYLHSVEETDKANYVVLQFSGQGRVLLLQKYKVLYNLNMLGMTLLQEPDYRHRLWLVITWQLILQGNCICEIRLYSLVIAVSGLGAVQSQNCVSFPEKGQKVFSSLQCIDRLWNPHSLLFNEYRKTFARIKPFGREELHSPLSRAKYNNKSNKASSPLYLITFLHAVARN
jgi:hypothetical protein